MTEWLTRSEVKLTQKKKTKKKKNCKTNVSDIYT